MNEFTLTKAFIEFASKGDPAKIVDQALQKTKAMQQAAASADFGKLAKQYVEANKEQDKILKNLSGIAQKEQEIAAKKAADAAAENAENAKRDAASKRESIAKKMIGVGAAADALIYRSVGQAAPVVMEQFNRALNDLSAVVGRMMIPYVESLTQKIRLAADWILNLDDSTKRIIATSIAAASGLSVVGVGLLALSKIATAVGLSLAATGGIGLAAAAGIAALVAVFSKASFTDLKASLGIKGGVEPFQKEKEDAAVQIANQAVEAERNRRNEANKQFREDNPEFTKQLRAWETALESFNVKNEMGQRRLGVDIKGLTQAEIKSKVEAMQKTLPFPQGLGKDQEAIFKSSIGLSATAQTAIMAPEDFIDKLQLEALKQDGLDDRGVRAQEKGAMLLENIDKKLDILNGNMEKELARVGMGE